MEWKAACEDIEEFMWSHLQEISSQTESQELIGELSQKLADHTSRVQELVQVPELTEGEVSLQVIIGLAAHQLLEANFFPGILEGLVGRLGLAPPNMTDPPTSVRAGMSRHWAATLREAVRRMEGGNINLRQVASTVVPYGLHLDYDLDFQTRRVDDVAPTLTSPCCLASLALSIILIGQQYLESLHPSRQVRTCGVTAGHLLSWMYPVHLMMMVWPPRDNRANGRARKMSLLAKERVLRIRLLWSLACQK